MTNYEKYKKEVDIIFDKNSLVAVDRNTNKLSTCHDSTCEDCLFFRKYNNGTHCTLSCVKWLVAEYVEPEVDWSKVPVDTPVLVSNDGKEWSRRHFSRVVDGIPHTWTYGSTSWTAYNNETTYHYIKLAEEE